MKKIILALFATFLIASCSTQKPLYSWYNYNDVNYEYNKTPNEKTLATLTKQYQKIANKQKGERKIVPPGFYAEYGYLLAKTGKKAEGIDMMKKEIQVYPESGKYVSKIIKQLEDKQ